jgi:protocatechuate 3,4-dioxygenase beta subunit
VLALAAALLTLAACDGGGTSPPVPARVDVVSGNGQTVPVGTQPAQPLVVKVVDEDGRPMPGVQVAWTTSAQGDVVAPSPATTDAQGQASAQWTLSSALGAHTVTATVAGVQPAQFTATRVVGPAATVQVVSGGGQFVSTGAQPQPQPLVVKVVDAAGNPVAGVQVAFTPTVQGDVVTPNPATTDAQGLATVQWTPNGTAGAHAVTASAAGAQPATFTSQVGVAPAYITVYSGNQQTVVRGRPATLAVRVFDMHGNPVSGASVAWIANYPQFNPQVSVSDAQGVASTVFTPSTSGGDYHAVTARLLATGYTAGFEVRATRPAVASVTLDSASYTAPCCDAGRRMVMTARDDLGNVIPDAPRTWSSTVDSVAIVYPGGDFLTAFPGTTTVTVSSEGKTATATLTVTPVGPGPVMQVYDAAGSRSYGGFLIFVRNAGGLVTPPWYDLRVRNVGGSGTIGGISYTVTYVGGGDAGWLNVSLSGTTAPAVLHVTPNPAVPVTRRSWAEVKVSSTTPGVSPVTYTFQYNP